MLQLTGVHHLTAVTADAKANHAFYTRTLGLRLAKKTVNQDDVSAYHLYYTDALGSPGTDVTFFDWPVPAERRGTNSIVRTGLRVADEASLQWWERRLADAGLTRQPAVTRDGRLTLDFDDFEGQRLAIVVDDGVGPAHPWDRSPVPPGHQVRGLGPVTISVAELKPTELLLTQVLAMRRAREYRVGPHATTVFAMGGAGPGAELHVVEEPETASARHGAGGVHHVAFRTPDDAQYDAWNRRLRDLRIPSSGPVDRFYFRSLYFREPNGILFEIATDGPGFHTDEPLEAMGQTLALPPFLEPRRREIEAGLKPI